jgi:hypothetical protein
MTKKQGNIIIGLLAVIALGIFGSTTMIYDLGNIFHNVVIHDPEEDEGSLYTDAIRVTDLGPPKSRWLQSRIEDNEVSGPLCCVNPE